MRMCACRGTAGFAHVSCLAEQAKILFAEAEENNLDDKVMNERWARWHTCSLCEQDYHGVVLCALSWACWKTYVGRAERDQARGMAMTELGAGLDSADHDADALSVKEARFSMLRRLGAPEENVLVAQSNLASTYRSLGRLEDCLRMQGNVYSGTLKLYGEEHGDTLVDANNYAITLSELERYAEAKSLYRKTISVARRVLGESHDLTLKMMMNYGGALYLDPGATLEDLRKAVTTLEEIDRTARRVLGGAHPTVKGIEVNLRDARAALRARARDVEPLRAAVEAMAPGDA